VHKEQQNYYLLLSNLKHSCLLESFMLGNNTDMIELYQIRIWIASSSKLGIASATLKKAIYPALVVIYKPRKNC